MGFESRMTPPTIIGEEARGAALKARLAAQAARRRRAARGDHVEARGLAARRAALRVAASALKARDGETSAHSEDVVLLCRAIADRLGIRGREREDLIAAAKLHDLGKLAVPMEILEKPSPLDEAEWAAIRQHTLVGQEILGAVRELQGIAAIVRSCHERYDGAGYPDGLAGDEIPLAARVVFCADAFHAIREDRPYRKGRSAARALAEVRRNSGTQFDPRVVEALEDAARALRQAGPERLHLLSAPLRSRRLVALLATLMIGGSTLAAAGVRLPLPFAGSGEPDRPAVVPPRGCGADCVVDLGRLGRAFPVTGVGQDPGALPTGGAYFGAGATRLRTARGARPLGAGGPARPGGPDSPGAPTAPAEGGTEPGTSEGPGSVPGAGSPVGRGGLETSGGGGGRPGQGPPPHAPVERPSSPVEVPELPAVEPPGVQAPDPSVELPTLPRELPSLPLRAPDVQVELSGQPRLP